MGPKTVREKDKGRERKGLEEVRGDWTEEIGGKGTRRKMGGKGERKVGEIG